MHYTDDRRQGLGLLLRAWDVCAGKSLPEKLLAFLRSKSSQKDVIRHPVLLLGVIQQSNQCLSVYYVPRTLLGSEFQVS